MAVPTSLFLFVAAAYKITLTHGEWWVVVVFAALLLSFVLLSVTRGRFCSLSSRIQFSIAAMLFLLLILGYWLVLLNVHSAT